MENNELIEQLRCFKANQKNKYCLDGLCTIGRVLDVFDGDTVTLVLPIGTGGALRWMKARLHGIDTPELRPRLNVIDRMSVIARAKAARDRLREMVGGDNGLVQVHVHGQEKYGRLLVSLFPLEVGAEQVGGSGGTSSFNALLVREGHAKEYDGSGRK